MLNNETAEGIRFKVEEQRADADRKFMEPVKQRST
jgi:hypothetical protein